MRRQRSVFDGSQQGDDVDKTKGASFSLGEWVTTTDRSHRMYGKVGKIVQTWDNHSDAVSCRALITVLFCFDGRSEAAQFYEQELRRVPSWQIAEMHNKSDKRNT